MCLKISSNAKNKWEEKTIIQKNLEMIKVLEETKQIRMLFLFELVRQLGYYNMLDSKARELTGLSKEDYDFIREYYTCLMMKYPQVKQEVQLSIAFINESKDNLKRIVQLKGCKNCIEKVTNKVDVTINDLCDKCRKEVESYMSHKE